MKVVVAIDSFKGSLSSFEAGNCIKKAIENVCDAEILVRPIADGGEGTVEALVLSKHGEIVSIEATDPLNRRISCDYGIIAKEKLAVIEIAQIAGLPLLKEEEKNPLYTTSYGVGEVILDGIEKGCRNFIIGIGGSATNDGGTGMLKALGYRFYDKDGNETGGEGNTLGNIASIDFSDVTPQLKECTFTIVCDVNNPLCGCNGAAAIFGPQKGATPEMIDYLDQAMASYSEVVRKATGKDCSKMPGSGAAGGIGFSCFAFLDSKMELGINFILQEIGLESDIVEADYVITGEGRLDFQTVMGKAPVGVAKLAKKFNKVVLAFAGGATKEASECNNEGIDAYFPVIQIPMSVSQAMERQNALFNLETTVTQVFRLIKSLKNRKIGG